METFEHPITGKKMQIANRDFHSISLKEANSACQELGDGWRLPTIYELEAIYQQLAKIGKGGFKTSLESSYWSSNQDGEHEHFPGSGKIIKTY
jgi:hypothetical protein